MKKIKRTNLQKNYEAIKKINPDFMKWIEKEKDVDWIEEIYSKNGDKNLLIKEGTEQFLAYDINNPSLIARNAAKHFKLYKENATIIIGFGLGYLVKAITTKTIERVTDDNK